MTIRLIVKGNADEAQRAAAWHGVNFTTVLAVPDNGDAAHRNETYLIAPEHTLGRVVAWYCDDDACINPPYPAGTLLFYR